ncbi:MAG: hypothetical protein H7831_13255 [Magnetococcus sp. WYHC-3]
MLAEQLEKSGMFNNINVLGRTGDGNLTAFRGDLVLVPGDLDPATGRPRHPKSLVHQAVMLMDGERIRFMAGELTFLETLPEFIARYSNLLAAEARPIFYVRNIKDSLQVTLDERRYTLIALREGIVWNELVDEFLLEKNDFKGQTPADKLITLYDGAKDYRPRYPEVTFTEAKTRTVALSADTRGAV